jgi:hypothetical protein
VRHRRRLRGLLGLCRGPWRRARRGERAWLAKGPRRPCLERLGRCPGDGQPGTESALVVHRKRRNAVFEKRISPGALPGVGTGSNVAEGRLCLLLARPNLGSGRRRARRGWPSQRAWPAPGPLTPRPAGRALDHAQGSLGVGTLMAEGPAVPTPGQEGWRGHGGEAPGGDRLNPAGPGASALGGRGTGATRSRAERERCR